jgi:putative DNA methylase
MSTHPIIAPKKLIEVALPLDEINKACAREKSIRHGHPSTLHLWWARRPLAAARAVLFAQLVNDPSWKYSEAELQKPQVKSAVTRKRNELFKLITELVQWESTNKEEVLGKARAEIRASWKETCEANKSHPDAKTPFDPGKLPAFHDPFAGGGSIPLEAQRLGLESHASDLNPVAVLINKAMIEIPPKFAGRAPVGPVPPGEKQTKAKGTDDWSGAKGLAEDVRRYGAWMRAEAEKRIGHLYPKVEITKEMAKERPDLKPLVGQELTVIAWLWARTVKSPNPAFSEISVPLASGFVLATRPGKEAYVEPIVARGNYSFVVRTGPPPSSAEAGTKLGRGANFRCLISGSPIMPDYIKAEGMAGRIGSRLMAVVAEGGHGRVYLAPVAGMEELAGTANPPWKPETHLPNDPRNFWLSFRFGGSAAARGPVAS